MGTTVTIGTQAACPKCGGPMWDNRGKKTNPKAPDFKCKASPGCDGVIWPPRNSAIAIVPAAPVVPAPAPAAIPVPANSSVRATVAGVSEIETRYLSMLERVGTRLVSLAAQNPQSYPSPTFADIQAATATIFIQEQKTAGGR